MEKKPKKTAWAWFITALAWVCVGLGLAAAGYGVHVTLHTDGKFSLANLSNFGSYAQGSVASLWSLGALFFLYATLLAQRQQIAQQEEEAEEQQIRYKEQFQLQQDQFKQQQLQFQQDMEKRKWENEQQQEQFKIQSQAVQLQNFESSFFQLLGLLGQVIAEMEDTGYHRAFGQAPEPVQVARRGCFKLWYDSLKSNFYDGKLEEIANVKLPTNQSDEILINAQNALFGQLPLHRQDIRIVKLYYEDFYQGKQELLGHYFRTLYHIVKFVDSSEALKSVTEKRRYVSLARAQLSAYELVLLFYNGISTNAIKFKPLMERYGLLEHLDEHLLLDNSHRGFYHDSAYS